MTENSKNTQERIIEAALYLAKNLGWKDTTIRRICQVANVSIGSFYHHFESKQEVVNKSYMLFDNSLLEDDDNENQSPFEKVKSLLIKQAEFIVTEAGKVTAEYYATLLQGEEYFAADPKRIYYKKVLAGVKEAEEIGQLKEGYSAEYVSKFLIKFNRGCVIDWCLNDYSYDVIDRIDEEIDLVAKLFFVK